MIFVLFLSLLASPNLSHAEEKSPDYCQYVLTSFLNNRPGKTEVSEIDEHLNDARDIVSKITAPYTRAGDLAVLFSSGIIYRAVGEELRLRGYNSAREIASGLLIFSQPDHNADQISLTNNVISRTLDLIGPLEVSTGSLAVKALEKRSKDLGLNLRDFLNLVGRLKTEKSEDYVTLKLTFLHAFLESPDHLADLVPKINFFSRALTKAPVPRQSVTVHPKSEEQAEGIISLKTKYLQYVATTKNGSDYDALFLTALREMDENYFSWAKWQVLELEVPKLLNVTSKVESFEGFKRAVLIFKNVYTRKLLYRTVAMQKLRDLRDTYAKIDKPRFEELNKVVNSLDSLVEGEAVDDAVRTKLSKLRSFEVKFKGFSYDEAFLGEVADFRANYLPKLSDQLFSNYIKSWVEQASRTQTEPGLIALLQAIEALTEGMPKSKKEFLTEVAALEASFRYSRVRTWTDAIHEAFFPGVAVSATKYKSIKSPADLDGFGTWSCFVKGTMIDTPQGPKPIETLRAGDEIYAFDSIKNQVVISHVLKPHVHFTRPVIRLTLADGSIVEVTAEHRVYSPMHFDYVAVRELRPGASVVVRYADGHESHIKSVQIVKKEKITKLVDVFNLEVEEHHNYFANGVLVHNGKG